MIDNESWQISIEQSAAFISDSIGRETVDFIFQNYGATCVEDLSPTYHSEVFNELFAIEADLRS